MCRFVCWLIVFAILWHTGLLHIIIMFITSCMVLIVAILASIFFNIQHFF